MHTDVIRPQRYKGSGLLLGAYLLWGALTIYWKLLDTVSAYEILAHRVIWCFLFVNIVLLLKGQFNSSWQEIKIVLSSGRSALAMIAASLLISLNWFTYIWAVTNERILETSLGYYINPLITVLLGIAVLKERLPFWQLIAFLLAALGVLYMTFQFGSLPWISLALALTFGLYGLVKKSTCLSALSSITLETLLVIPIALGYLIWLYANEGRALQILNVKITLLLLGSGAVTALPLLLFSAGVKLMPLSAAGFFQYLSPTISLFIGIFMFNETFTAVHAITFACIWLALLLYSLSHAGLLPEKRAEFARGRYKR